MARPDENTSINQGSSLFASEMDAEIDVIRKGPFPPKEYPLLTNFPVPGLYDRCIAAAANTGLIYMSLNNAWVPIPMAMVDQTDSVAADIAAMVVDFNALLAKLRTANHI